MKKFKNVDKFFKGKKFIKVPAYFCCFNKTFSNLFATVTDLKGNVIFNVSTGNLFKKRTIKKVKCSPNTAILLGRLLGFKLKLNKIFFIILKFKSKPNNFIFKNVLKGVFSVYKKLKIVCYFSTVREAHNGCRGSKKRKL